MPNLPERPDPLYPRPDMYQAARALTEFTATPPAAEERVTPIPPEQPAMTAPPGRGKRPQPVQAAQSGDVPPVTPPAAERHNPSAVAQPPVEGEAPERDQPKTAGGGSDQDPPKPPHGGAVMSSPGEEPEEHGELGETQGKIEPAPEEVRQAVERKGETVATREVSEVSEAAPAIATPAEVLSRCSDEVQAEISSMRSQLDKGEPFTHDSYIIGRTIEDMAQDAAAAGDQAQVETHIDTLLKLPDVSKITLAEACFAGIETGSERAFDILRGALEAERLKAQQDIVTRKEEFPHILRPHISTALLKGVVELCGRNGISPDSWIEQYAPDNESQWELYMQYHGDLAKSGAPDADSHRQQLEAKASELLEGGNYPADFAYDQMWGTLLVVESPDLRARLIQRFIQSSSEVPLTSDTFKTLTWVGGAVLQDPALANQDTVGIFEATIERCAQILQEHNMDAFTLAEAQLAWRMNLKRYYGATPQEFIDSLDFQISELLSADIPDSSDRTMATTLRNRDFVTSLREGQLEAYAEHYAKQGDFTTARLFLSNIMSGSSALQRCLGYATSPEQVALIKPDEMTLAFNPRLGMHVQFTEVRLSGDAASLADLALEYARTVKEGDGYVRRVKHEYIETAYKTIAGQDEPQAAQLANELLAIFRENSEAYREVSYLSEALIQAGDTEEPQRAYEHIDQSSSNPSHRLTALWRLATLLRRDS